VKPELVSVVLPVHNEEGSLRELHARLKTVFNNAGMTYELVFVDDGSTDNSLRIIRDIGKEDRRCRCVSFTRNFGHEAASTAGLQRARGDAVVLMDADLQDPPEIIPTLVAKWKEGYEVVYVRRRKRMGESVFKRFTAWMFYRMLNALTEIKIPADVGDFRLMDRRVVEAFRNLPETNRFVRGMIAWLGYRETGVAYDRPERRRGQTKYNPFKLTYLAFDATVSFSTSLLRLSTFTGFVVGLVSLVMVIVIVVQKLFFGIPIQGYALVASGLFFLGGLILLYLGLLGEYVAKVYRQSQARPLYIVKEEIGDTSL
jgi:glycosyltransferase involved in cell wall biosynthesis